MFLEHNVLKLRENFSVSGTSPFGGDLPVPPDAQGLSAVSTPAEVEYRVNSSLAGGEQVVGVKSRGDIAATAFKSGEAPVTLQVTTAGLTAQQLEGSSEELPVSVRVGDQGRVMKVGEIARFGNVEVVI